jgi:hypothetical protein
VKITIFWAETLCSSVEIHGCFEGTYCLSLQGRKVSQANIEYTHECVVPSSQTTTGSIVRPCSQWGPSEWLFPSRRARSCFVSRARNQQLAGSKSYITPGYCWLLLALLFGPQDGGDTFVRNVCRLLPNYTALQVRRSCPSLSPL